MHRLDLVLGQRQHAVEAAQQRRDALDGAPRVRVQRGAGGDRGLARDPRAHDVAEVDDAAGHEAAAAVAAGDDVPLRDVAVDDAAAQRRAEAVEASRRSARRRARPGALARRVAHLAEQRRDDVGGVLQVPLQERGPAAGWSKSASPTAIVAAAAPMPSSSASGRWCWSATGSPSIQLTSRTSNVSPPRSTGTISRPSRAGSGTGVSSASALRGQVVHGRVLQHERVAAEARVRDLQDRARAAVVQQDVLVLLRPELAGRPADAEVLLRDRHGLVVRELGVAQREAGEGVARRHRPRR